MSWRLAGSLVALRSEVDARWPARSRRSDGAIGDPAHAARASRHNKNRFGVVTALDITHDPASGCDVHAVARQVARDPHPELEYIISDRQIASRPSWTWRAYRGDNPHTAHAHFAVGRGPDADPRPPYDSTQPWGIADTGGLTVADIDKLLARLSHLDDHLHQNRDRIDRLAADVDMVKRELRQTAETMVAQHAELRRNTRRAAVAAGYPPELVEGAHTVVEDGVDASRLPVMRVERVAVPADQ